MEVTGNAYDSWKNYRMLNSHGVSCFWPTFPLSCDWRGHLAETPGRCNLSCPECPEMAQRLFTGVGHTQGVEWTVRANCSCSVPWQWKQSYWWTDFVGEQMDSVFSALLWEIKIILGPSYCFCAYVWIWILLKLPWIYNNLCNSSLTYYNQLNIFFLFHERLN